MVLELTLAAVSSSGVLASEGSSADWAGWNAVLITATVAARMYTVPTGAWVRTQTVIVASPTARSRSEASITGTRG